MDDDAVSRGIRRLVPRWRNCPIRDIAWLEGGYSNRNWRFRVGAKRYVVRLVRRPGPRPEERRYLRLPPAPTVVAFDEERGDLVTEWIDAPTMAARPASPEETGRRIARLHAAIPAGIRRYDLDGELDAFFRTAGDAVAADVPRIRSRLAWRPERLAGCHNDLNPWNILRSTGTWRVLDWEYAGDNDPLFDLVGLSSCMEWSWRETVACIGAYAAAPPPDDRIRQTLAAFRLREYGWAAAQIARGNDRAEIRAQAADSLAAVRDLV